MKELEDVQDVLHQAQMRSREIRQRLRDFHLPTKTNGLSRNTVITSKSTNKGIYKPAKRHRDTLDVSMEIEQMQLHDWDWRWDVRQIQSEVSRRIARVDRELRDVPKLMRYWNIGSHSPRTQVVEKQKARSTHSPRRRVNRVKKHPKSERVVKAPCIISKVASSKPKSEAATTTSDPEDVHESPTLSVPVQDDLATDQQQTVISDIIESTEAQDNDEEASKTQYDDDASRVTRVTDAPTLPAIDADDNVENDQVQETQKKDIVVSEEGSTTNKTPLVEETSIRVKLESHEPKSYVSSEKATEGEDNSDGKVSYAEVQTSMDYPIGLTSPSSFGRQVLSQHQTMSTSSTYGDLAVLPSNSHRTRGTRSLNPNVLRRLFNDLDTDRDGYINRIETSVALHRLQIAVPVKKLASFFLYINPPIQHSISSRSHTIQSEALISRQRSVINYQQFVAFVTVAFTQQQQRLVRHIHQEQSLMSGAIANPWHSDSHQEELKQDDEEEAMEEENEVPVIDNVLPDHKYDNEGLVEVVHDLLTTHSNMLHNVKHLEFTESEMDRVIAAEQWLQQWFYSVNADDHSLNDCHPQEEEVVWPTCIQEEYQPPSISELNDSKEDEHSRSVELDNTVQTPVQPSMVASEKSFPVEESKVTALSNIGAVAAAFPVDLSLLPRSTRSVDIHPQGNRIALLERLCRRRRNIQQQAFTISKYASAADRSSFSDSNPIQDSIAIDKSVDNKPIQQCMDAENQSEIANQSIQSDSSGIVKSFSSSSQSECASVLPLQTKHFSATQWEYPSTSSHQSSSQSSSLTSCRSDMTKSSGIHDAVSDFPLATRRQQRRRNISRRAGSSISRSSYRKSIESEDLSEGEIEMTESLDLSDGELTGQDLARAVRLHNRRVVKHEKKKAHQFYRQSSSDGSKSDYKDSSAESGELINTSLLRRRCHRTLYSSSAASFESGEVDYDYISIE